MMKILVAIALLAVACGAGPEPDGPEITGACRRALPVVMETWERLTHERLHIECTLLDQEYEVQVVDSSDEMPCPRPDPGEQLAGCMVPEARVIFILGGRDSVAMVDTAVHEWIHALAECEIGDADYWHLRAGLWEKHGPESIETQAQAAATVGECL